VIPPEINTYSFLDELVKGVYVFFCWNFSEMNHFIAFLEGKTDYSPKTAEISLACSDFPSICCGQGFPMGVLVLISWKQYGRAL